MSSSNNIFYWMDALGWSPGLFCSYQSVIGFLNFCEQENPIGYRVFFEKGLYFDANTGPNWWEYYFEPINGGEIKDDTIVEHIGDTPKSQWGTDAISVISRERAAEIINKYIKLKPFMQNKINEIINNQFGDYYIIGIHYRGCDKSSEAPRVPFDKVRQEILRVAAPHSNYKVFVATDELGFLTYMQSHFNDRVVSINAIRSPNQEPIHHSGGNVMENRYKLGEDAVIDCYLLSKTNILIRTQSNLSSSAANINPALPIIDLNQAFYRQGLR